MVHITKSKSPTFGIPSQIIIPLECAITSAGTSYLTFNYRWGPVSLTRTLIRF